MVATVPAAPGVDPRFSSSPLRGRDPCEQRYVPDEKLLDQRRRDVEEATCDLALWLDGLFGDRKRSNIVAARSINGDLEVSEFYSQFSGSTFRFRFHVHVDLPNVKERLSVFAGRDNQDDFVRDRSESEALRTRFPRLNDKYDTIAGLGYSLPSRDWFTSKFQAGVSLHSLKTPSAFVHLRLAMNAYADEFNLVHLGATPFYSTVNLWGLTTSADYTRVLTPTVLLRWGSNGTLSQTSAGVDWRTAWILYHALGNKRAIAYETFIRGATRAAVPLGEYGAKVLYRQPFIGERLLAEFVLGYSFPQDDPLLERKGAAVLGLNVSLPFGPKAP